MELSDLPPTDAPLLGEPPAIELVNATYAVRGRLRDGLGSVPQLASWLHGMRPRLSVALTDADLHRLDEVDLAAAHALRDAVRALATAAVTDTAAPPDAVDVLNAAVRRVPAWPELVWGEQPVARRRIGGPPVPAVLAELAASAVSLFTGSEFTELRACPGPGCVLFFVKDHSRRAWCSPGCGNRARAARHYDRSRRSL